VFASLGAGVDTAVLGTAGTLEGGSGPDRLSVVARTGEPSWLEGDAGDDRLIAPTKGDNTLDGGPGDDLLASGAGADSLAPGSGEDTVDGGPGTDRLTYTGSTAIHVDLARGSAWSAVGRDRLRAIEDVTTGGGNDVVFGDAGPNDIDGGFGRNTIIAGSGDDTLHGIGPGSSCGAGEDAVAVPAESYEEDVVPTPLRAPAAPDCEFADLEYLARIKPHPSATSSSVTIHGIRIEDTTEALGWALRAGWTGRGALLGLARGRGRREHVTIPLNARGRACIAGGRCRASLTVSELDEELAYPESSYPLPLTLAPEFVNTA
jgi:Ca2+-binding RTX toxin-like protein